MFLHLLEFEGVQQNLYKIVLSNETSNVVKNNHNSIYTVKEVHTYDVNGLDPATNSEWQEFLSDYNNHKYFVRCQDISTLTNIIEGINNKYNAVEDILNEKYLEESVNTNQPNQPNQPTHGTGFTSKLVSNNETLSKYNQMLVVTTPGITITIPKNTVLPANNADQIIIRNLQQGVAYLKDDNLGTDDEAGLLRLNTLSSEVQLSWNGVRWVTMRENNINHELSKKFTISSPDPPPSPTADTFTSNLKISSDGMRIATSCYTADNLIGILYIYKWNSAQSQWEEEAKIRGSNVPTVGGSITQFVKLNNGELAFNHDGTKLFAGNQDHGANSEGGIYYFQYDKNDSNNRWKLAQTFIDASINGLGYSVACTPDGKYFIGGSVSGNKALVYGWNNGNNSYEFESYINTPDSTILGWSSDISADGNHVVLGYPFANVDGGSLNGKVYFFTRDNNTWVNSGNIVSSYATSASQGQFGFNLDLSDDGNTLCISSYGEQTDNGSGRVHIYVREDNTWTKVQELIGFNPGESAFGTYAQLSGNGKYMIATTGDYETGAYLYKRRANMFYVEKQFKFSGGTSGACSLSSDSKIVCIGSLQSDVPTLNIYQ